MGRLRGDLDPIYVLEHRDDVGDVLPRGLTVFFKEQLAGVAAGLDCVVGHDARLRDCGGCRAAAQDQARLDPWDDGAQCRPHSSPVDEVGDSLRVLEARYHDGFGAPYWVVRELSRPLVVLPLAPGGRGSNNQG